MSEIQPVSIGVSRYAPVEVVNYQYNGMQDLSFGQLVMAVCCRRAALVEEASVVKMNALADTTAWLKALSVVGERIFTVNSLGESADIGGTGYVCRNTVADPTMAQFLQLECGVDSDHLKIGTHDERQTLFAQIKTTLDGASSTSQQQTIALQSLVSRRDVTYNASAATVRAIGQSMLAMAAAIK